MEEHDNDEFSKFEINIAWLIFIERIGGKRTRGCLSIDLFIDTTYESLVLFCISIFE